MSPSALICFVLALVTALGGPGCGHLVVQINHPLLSVTKRGALQSFEAFAPLDVSVYPAAIVVPVGESQELTVRVNDDKGKLVNTTVNVESKNASVAGLKERTVLGVSVGETSVVVSAAGTSVIVPVTVVPALEMPLEIKGPIALSVEALGKVPGKLTAVFVGGGVAAAERFRGAATVPGFDPDKNGDGLVDNGHLDTDRDGIPNFLDPDGDGVPNAQDPDIDGDGIPNQQDPDMDGDGIPNASDADQDGDQVPDALDIDDNNDGIIDVGASPPPTSCAEPIVWTSSNPAVATVNAGGEITAVGPIITARQCGVTSNPFKFTVNQRPYQIMTTGPNGENVLAIPLAGTS